MQINSTVAGELRAWGARYLGQTPALSEAEARAALLQRLSSENWVPDRRAVSAYQLVAGSATGLPAGALLDGLGDLETLLREEIDDFAKSFFMLDTATRLARWQALKQRGDWLGPVNARLEHLRAGLTVEPAKVAHADPLVARFADFLGEMFVLRAGPRALRRRQILEEIDRDQVSWQRAARVLKVQWPRIAALDAPLSRLIAHPGEVATEQRQARRRPHRAFEGRSRQPAKQGGGSNWWVFLVIILVLGVLRAALLNPSSNPPPPVHFQPQNFEQRDLNKMIERLLKEQKQERQRAPQ